MIKINLLGETKDNSVQYVLHLGAVGSVLAILIFGSLIHYQSVASDLRHVENRRDQLNQQLARLKKKTDEVDKLENKRRLLGEKLTTIAKLKAKKQGPVRVLDDVTKTIPRTAWLQRIAQSGTQLEFTGVALDNQTISQFMVDLEDSVYFEKVDLKQAKRKDRDKVKLQQFALTAKLTDPLKRKKEMESKAKKEMEKKAEIEKAQKKEAAPASEGSLAQDAPKEASDPAPEEVEVDAAKPEEVEVGVVTEKGGQAKTEVAPEPKKEAPKAEVVGAADEGAVEAPKADEAESNKS